MQRTSDLMKHGNIFVCSLIYLASTFMVQTSLAGLCWDGIDKVSNLCRGNVIGNMTRERCCSLGHVASVSWMPNMNSSDFFYNFYVRPVPTACHRCHTTCKNVHCPEDMQCRMVDGLPQCVCRPNCSASIKSRGRLCGSDGRKYRNYCSLQRANCKTMLQTRVEYYGRCRRSCKLVQCEVGKRCLEDQNGYPHCIKCRTTCPRNIPDDPRHYVCAVDGKTYKSTCDLEAEVCKRGQGISISYRGACNAGTNCSSVTCPRGRRCLTHYVTKQPVCIDCSYCVASSTVQVCGTDGRTYSNYCDMIKTGCYLGQYITTRRNGRCKNKKNSKRSRLRISSIQDNHIKRKGNFTKRQKRRKGKHKRLSKKAKAKLNSNDTIERRASRLTRPRKRRNRRKNHRQKKS